MKSLRSISLAVTFAFLALMLEPKVMADEVAVPFPYTQQSGCVPNPFPCPTGVYNGSDGTTAVTIQFPYVGGGGGINWTYVAIGIVVVGMGAFVLGDLIP